MNKVDLRDVYMAKVGVVIDRHKAAIYPFNGTFLVRPIITKFPRAVVGFEEVITGKKIIKRKFLSNHIDYGIGWIKRYVDIESTVKDIRTHEPNANDGELSWDILMVFNAETLLSEEEIEEYFKQSEEEIEQRLIYARKVGRTFALQKARNMERQRLEENSVKKKVLR